MILYIWQNNSILPYHKANAKMISTFSSTLHLKAFHKHGFFVLGTHGGDHNVGCRELQYNGNTISFPS